MEKINCPHCEKDIHLGACGFIPEEQRLVISLQPKEGTFVRAETVAKVIGAYVKLSKEIAKDAGLKNYTECIEKIETDADGEIKIYLIGTEVK